MSTKNNTPATTSEVEAQELPIEYRLAAQKHLLDRMTAEHKELLAEYGKQFSPGDKSTAQNPQGVTLASFAMTQPTRVAVCNDPAILAAMAEDKGMEIIDVLPHDSERLQELLNYVYETRPELLDASISNDDKKKLGEEVFDQWLIDGKVPAGWEIKEASKPSFRLTKSRSKQATAVIDHLFGKVADVLALNPGKES